jgi:hypothetical protein
MPLTFQVAIFTGMGRHQATGSEHAYASARAVGAEERDDVRVTECLLEGQCAADDLDSSDAQRSALEYAAGRKCGGRPRMSVGVGLHECGGAVDRVGAVIQTNRLTMGELEGSWQSAVGSPQWRKLPTANCQLSKL